MTPWGRGGTHWTTCRPEAAGARVRAGGHCPELGAEGGGPACRSGLCHLSVGGCSVCGPGTAPRESQTVSYTPSPTDKNLCGGRV